MASHDVVRIVWNIDQHRRFIAGSVMLAIGMNGSPRRILPAFASAAAEAVGGVRCGHAGDERARVGVNRVVDHPTRGTARCPAIRRHRDRGIC